MRDNSEEHLRGSEGVAQGVVLTVRGKSQLGRQLPERQEPRRRFAPLGQQKAPEHVGVEHGPAQPEPLTSEGHLEESPLHFRSVSYEDSARHRLQERDYRFV
jgi:hypothetical protein